MKIQRTLYLSVLTLVLAMGTSLFISAALAQLPIKTYENRQFLFAITPPPSWTKQVSTPSEDEIVVKFIDSRGTLSVAARPAEDYHREIIDLISKYNLSEKQLADLAQDMYGSVPGVIEPTLIITQLSSHKALGSYYAYEHRQLGAVIYMVLFKAETTRGDIFYKVEMAGPSARTLEEASRLFTNSSKLLLEHMRTFTFLPGKP